MSLPKYIPPLWAQESGESDEYQGLYCIHPEIDGVFLWDYKHKKLVNNMDSSITFDDVRGDNDI